MGPKVSSSDDIQGYKRPEPSSRESSKPRRPASIATSKPMRPMAPPPKPPPSRNNSKETSPEEIYIYDDASAMKRAPLASGSEAKEPIYDTMKEVPVKSGEESIYSSLMRKDKRKKKRRSPTED